MPNDHKIDRKLFLSWTAAAAGSALLACSNNGSTPNGGSGGAGGQTGAGGAGSGGESASGGANGSGGTIGSSGTTIDASGSDAGVTDTGSGGNDVAVTTNCSTQLKVTITQNHPAGMDHVLVVPLADLTGGFMKVYDAKGNSSHSHWVAFTAVDFQSLMAGKTVTKGSCNGGHEHEFIVNCVGAAGVEISGINAFCNAAGHRECGAQFRATCAYPPA